MWLSFLLEIVDGNPKMTLGMIWTIILRFAIQDITVEGVYWSEITLDLRTWLSAIMVQHAEIFASVSILHM